MARQKSQAVHVLGAALAYLRSLAASALSKEPYNISWKDVAFVMKEVHQDIVMLANLHTDCGPPLCTTYHAKHDRAFGGFPEIAVNQSIHSSHLSLPFWDAHHAGGFALIEPAHSARHSTLMQHRYLVWHCRVCRQGPLRVQSAEQAMDIAHILLKAECLCCDKYGNFLACRSLYLLMSGALHAGNLMEACRAMWVLHRLDSKAPKVMECGISPESRK